MINPATAGTTGTFEIDVLKEDTVDAILVQTGIAGVTISAGPRSIFNV